MLTFTVLPIVSLILWGIFGVFACIILLRLIFNYADPNPFGTLGRIGFKIRKATEKWVYPAARLFAQYGIDTRLAPIVTLIVGLIVVYFLTQIIANTFFIIDGLTTGVVSGQPMVVIGFVLYALLSVLILLIFIRFLSSWFVFTRKSFLSFVVRVTDPILVPVRKIIPPIGMFDLSAMLVLIIIGVLQSVVLRVFVFR